MLPPALCQRKTQRSEKRATTASLLRIIDYHWYPHFLDAADANAVSLHFGAPIRSVRPALRIENNPEKALHPPSITNPSPANAIARTHCNNDFGRTFPQQ
jgi:hypothetical protein